MDLHLNDCTMTVVHKGVAHPWQCDVLGHMTTRFYVAMFDDACYHFLYSVFGWSGSQDSKGRLAWADVRHVINYQAEVAAGDLLQVRACLTRIGGKSISVLYEMENLTRGEIAATQESTSVLFDLKKRKSAAMSDELRQKATVHLRITVDEE
jgi:acyl-CoA thioester hydrolase